MSVIFKGVEMPTACCFVDGEHSAFAHFEYCKFYNICEKRDTIKTNCKPSDCPVKALEQEPFKPMVEIDLDYVIKQKYIEREVLDKIRAQIKSNLRGVEIALEVLVENNPLRPKMEGAKDTLEECLEIIDKAESEGT